MLKALAEMTLAIVILFGAGKAVMDWIFYQVKKAAGEKIIEHGKRNTLSDLTKEMTRTQMNQTGKKFKEDPQKRNNQK